MGKFIYNFFRCGGEEVIWGVSSNEDYPDFTILEDISTGYRYHVRKAVIFYYTNPDKVQYLGNPDESFIGGSDVVEWNSKIMFNGHSFPPISQIIDRADVTVFQGTEFNLTPAPYNSLIKQTTNVGAKYLNILFENAGVEMRAFPFIHDNSVTGNDIVAIIFNETDNFLVEIEKTTNGAYIYNYELFGQGGSQDGYFSWNGVDELTTANYIGRINVGLISDKGFKRPEGLQNLIVSNCFKEALYSSCVNNYGGGNLISPTGEVFSGTGTMTYLVKTMDEARGVFGYFDEGNTDYDWEFTSFKVNGVEHITTPIVQTINPSYFNYYECFVDGCNVLPNFEPLNGRIITDIDEKVYRNLITLFGYENRIMVEKWGRSQNGISFVKFSVDELINTVEFVYKRIFTGGSFFEYNLSIDNTVNSIELEADTISLGDNYAKALEYGQGCRCSDLRPCKDCECSEPRPCCPEGDVTLSFATFVKLPPVGVPDRGFKECCFSLMVLADLNSSDIERNDFNSFYFKKQSPSDSCNFFLMKNGTDYALDSTIYGQFWDFGDFVEQPNLTVVRVDWRKVLSVLGEGDYSIRQDISIAGLSISQTSNTFTLKHYTTVRADKTIRIDSIFDGRLVAQGVDFFGTGFETTLRVGGFFGNAQRKIEEDIVIRRNYKKEQIKMSQTSEYTLETNLLPECITSEIFDFMLMANRVLISDYNSNNHSYKYTRFGVKIIDDKGTDYPIFKRSAKINLTFTDELVNKVKLNY